MADTRGDIVDDIGSITGLIAAATALRAEMIDQARQWSETTELASMPSQGSGSTPSGPIWSGVEIARRELVTELACTLRMPESTVEKLVNESQYLCEHLPATLNSLRLGRISYRHAQTVIDHASSLPDDAGGGFEEQLVPVAETSTVPRLERVARALRERRHPESIERRRMRAAEDRSVRVDPGRDGMASIEAQLPADTAFAISDRIGRIAAGLKAAGDTRTLTQLRADVFAGLLIDGDTCEGMGRGIQATVIVTVPVLTLLGHSDEPAILEGYGPIDIETAKQLASNAPSLIRVLTHPETGAVLSVGRDRYTVPADLRTWLRVRDETCRFPGCGRMATGCDIDHTIDWQHGGPTAHDNLAFLCRKHHLTKHHTRWTVKQKPGATLEWTSPQNRTYTTDAATRIEPVPPERR